MKRKPVTNLPDPKKPTPFTILRFGQDHKINGETRTWIPKDLEPAYKELRAYQKARIELEKTSQALRRFLQKAIESNNEEDLMDCASFISKLGLREGRRFYEKADRLDEEKSNKAQ